MKTRCDMMLSGELWLCSAERVWSACGGRVALGSGWGPWAPRWRARQQLGADVPGAPPVSERAEPSGAEKPRDGHAPPAGSHTHTHKHTRALSLRGRLWKSSLSLFLSLSEAQLFARTVCYVCGGQLRSQMLFLVLWGWDVHHICFIPLFQKKEREEEKKKTTHCQT